MRIRKNISKGIISWSNSKFPKVAPWELYGIQWWELQLVIQYNTISITYQYNMTHKWQELRKISVGGLLVDQIPKNLSN